MNHRGQLGTDTQGEPITTPTLIQRDPDPFHRMCMAYQKLLAQIPSLKALAPHADWDTLSTTLQGASPFTMPTDLLKALHTIKDSLQIPSLTTTQLPDPKTALIPDPSAPEKYIVNPIIFSSINALKNDLEHQIQQLPKPPLQDNKPPRPFGSS